MKFKDFVINKMNEDRERELAEKNHIRNLAEQAGLELNISEDDDIDRFTGTKNQMRDFLLLVEAYEEDKSRMQNPFLQVKDLII